MRKLEIEVTYKYQIEVDDNDDIVKEYEDDEELVNDLATYRFGSVLPVVQENAIRIKDIELVEVVSFNNL